MTLPKLGQDRAYAIPHAAKVDAEPTLEACACAIQNALVSHRSVMDGDAPRYEPPEKR